MKNLARALLIAAGVLFTALGVLGMFLPLLPTTPFLLLAALCFAKSSKRFYDRLLHNRLCGPYLRNYREGAGISRRRKVLTIILLWLTIGASALFFVSRWWGKAALVVVASGVTIHLVMMKTHNRKPLKAEGHLKGNPWQTCNFPKCGADGPKRPEPAGPDMSAD